MSKKGLSIKEHNIIMLSMTACIIDTIQKELPPPVAKGLIEKIGVALKGAQPETDKIISIENLLDGALRIPEKPE